MQAETVGYMGVFFALICAIILNHCNSKFKAVILIFCGLAAVSIAVSACAAFVCGGLLGHERQISREVNRETIELAPCADGELAGKYVIVDKNGECNYFREDGFEPEVSINTRETSNIYFYRNDLNPRLEIVTNTTTTRREWLFIYSERTETDDPNYEFYTPFATTIFLPYDPDTHA